MFDFACGSGSLLLNVRHRMAESGGTIGRIVGMEKNITTYNLCRMNMLLHGVKNTEFEIYHGDTLTNDWDYLRETNPAKQPKFDAVVANPPFSYRWEPGDAMGEDMRFKAHGVAPKSAADFAFVLHGLHYLKEDGVMAIILLHGVLFRGGVEERIRTYQTRPKQVERHCRRVGMKEIVANDYNLNISRYVSTAQQEQEIDRAATHRELVGIEDAVRKATAKHNQLLKELGLPPLPSK